MNEVDGYVLKTYNIHIHVLWFHLFFGVSTRLTLTITYHHHVSGKQKDFKFTMLKTSCTNGVGPAVQFQGVGSIFDAMGSMDAVQRALTSTIFIRRSLSRVLE